MNVRNEWIVAYKWEIQEMNEKWIKGNEQTNEKWINGKCMR